ncbi:transmembrane protein, partial [Cystoisospora suis]
GLSSDGFFVPVSTVRTRSQHGSNPAVGGSHNARKQCRGGGGNSNNGQKGSGSSVHAPSGVSGASEAAAKIALEQKHRLSHLPVHLHAAHCILGLTGVPATAAAVDEAYCRQLVLVGDPPAVTQGGGSNLCSGTKCKTAPAPHDGINSGVTNSREEADSDVPRGMEEGVSRIRGSSLTEKRGGQEEGCPFGEKVNSFSSLLEGLPVSPTMSKSPFRHEDDSLLSGSFGSVVRGSWRREYVFKRVVGDIVEGSSLTGGSSYTPSSDGGGKPSWGSGTQQLALPRYEDFCDLLGVLHRARTAAQLFLALNRYPGAAGSVTHPASSSISSATANPTTSVTSEVVGAKAKTLEGGIRNHVSSEGGCPDLWSSCLFVPGPSPFSFAINKRSGGGKAGAEVTSFRGQETVVEEVEGGSSPGSSTGSSEERGSRSSMPAAVLQLSGAAVTSTYLQRRREDAQLIVQAFLVAFVFTRMRLQAAIGKFVTRKEGLCTSKQANQLQEMFRLSSDWIRTGGGGGKLATSLLTAQEDRSKYTCLGPPAELPRCLEYEFSAHPVAVAVREKLFLLLRLLLLDSSPAGVFERWKGRTHQGEELDSEPVEDVRKTRFDMLRQPWMFDRGYSILADLGNGSTVLHFAARFGCIEALSIVSFEVAPTTWWKCMLKKNNDGDLPVDVALRWHPIGGEVAEAFADASKRAKEVEAYRLYLNKRKCGFGAFAKAIFFALFAAFVPTSILSIPFFFTFFGEGVADTFALRVSVALLLFIGEFIVRQTGLGERCFSFYAGLAVGAGFSLVQIFSDLTHDILIEGIYMESAVRVCLLVLFFHYAATPSSVSRIGDCITEVFVVLWRSLRRVGRACGLGRLLSPLRGWSRLFLEASPQPPAAPEVLGQYSCHLTVHQHNRGSGFGQHSGGGGVTSSRGSSLSAISPSGHGDVRGGGSGAASRPGSSANQVFSSTTSSVSGGGEGRHPREDSRNISSVGGSKHEPRGRKVGSKKDLSKLTSWLSISMRPFGHLASRTKSFLIMLSAAIQHCFDIRYTIRVIATAFLLMGLTSSMIAGWWLVTDDFTYAVFSWSSTPTGEDSLSSSYYQHRHPDPRVVQTPPGPVPRQRGTGPEGYSFHSRPAAGLPPHRVPNSVLENGSVHTFVGGTGGGYLRSYPDRSAQISEVRVHDAAATQNMWSAPGLPGTSETGKDDTYRHFPPSLGFSVLGHHDWDDGDIFTSLPSSALELCQAGPLESTAVAYNLSFKEAVAETFSGSEGSGAQVGGASGLSSAVAESVLMMLSRSPVISESLKETFRHHSFDNGTYGEVCRVWRSTKLREAYKLLDVHFPMAGDQQVVEDAVDVTERDEDRAKEAPHQGSGNAAQSARAPAGPEESSDGGEVTPRDSEDSAGARDPWREEGGEQSEKGEVEGKAGAPSLFSGVSEKEGRSLPEAKKGTNGTAPEPLSPSSYSTVFHTNTRPSSDSSQSDRLHHRACPRGRCRAQRVSANSFGHGFARQQAEDEQERELCRWTSHRVGTRGETELEWTGDADGGTAVPSLQLMAYCIKRLENGLRKKAGLPQVDDERFYEAVRSRLVEALLQLDISAVSEEDFVSILFPLICMGCTEFDDVTGACIGHDREAQRRRQQQAMHCARRVHAWHLQRVITGVNEEDQGENSRLEGGCTTTDVEAASERNSPSGRTVKANFEIATGYNYFQLYRPLRGFWSRVRQNSSASSAGREENRKMAQRVERAAALLWPLGSPAARRVLGLSASVSGAGAPSPAGAEGSEASSGFRSGDRSIQGLRSDVATGECSKRYSIHMEGAPSPYPVDKKPSEASTGAAVAALCSFMDQTDTVDTEPEPCPECAQQILRLQQLREGMRCYRQLLLRVLARRRRTGYSTPPPASTSVGLGGAESLRSAVGVEGEEGKNLQEGREESRTDNSFTSRELHDDRVSGQGDPQVEQGGNAPFTRADSIFGSRGVEGLEEKPEEALLQGLLSIQRGGLLRSVKRILFYGTLRQNERIKQGHGTTADQRGGEGASGRRGNDTVGGARSPTDRKQANTSRRSCQNYHSDSWSANQAGGTAAKSSKKAGGSSQHIGHRDNGPGALPGGKLPHNQKEGVKRYRWYTVLIGIVLGIAGSAVAWLVYQCWVEHCAEWYSQQLQQEESNLSLRLNEPNKKGHPTGVKGGGNKCAGKKSAAVPSVGQHPRKPQNAHQNSSSLPTPVSSPIAVCSAPSSPAGPPGASVAASATALSRPTASAGEHGLFVCSANASHAASGIVTAAKEKLNAANLGCRGGGAGTGKTQSEPPELKGEEEKADSGAGVGVAPQLGGDKQALPDLRQPEEREEGSRGATERGAAHGRLGVKKDRRDTSAHTSETTVIDNGEDATDALRNSLKSSDTKLVANLASARKRDKEEECEGRTGKSEDRLTHTFGDEWSESGRHGEEGKRLTGARVSTALRSGSSLEGEGSSKEAQTGPPLRVEIGTNRRAVDAPAAEGDDKEESLSLAGAASAEEEWEFVVSGKPKRQHEKKTSVSSPTAAVSTAQASRRSSLVAMQSAPAGASKKPTPTSAQRSGEKGTPMEMTKVQQGRPYQTTRRLTKPQHPVLLDKAGHVRTGPLRKQAEHFLGSYRSSSNNFTQPGTEPGKDRVPGCASVPASDAALGKGGKSAWTVCADHRAKYSASGHAHSQVAVRGAHPLKSSLDEGINPKWEGGEERPGSSRGGGYGGTQTSGRDRGVVLSPRSLDDSQQVEQLQKLLAALRALNASYDLAKCQLPHWALDCLDEEDALQLRDKHGWRIVPRHKEKGDKQNSGLFSDDGHVLSVPKHIVQRLLEHQGRAVEAQRRAAAAVGEAGREETATGTGYGDGRGLGDGFSGVLETQFFKGVCKGLSSSQTEEEGKGDPNRGGGLLETSKGSPLSRSASSSSQGQGTVTSSPSQTLSAAVGARVDGYGDKERKNEAVPLPYTPEGDSRRGTGASVLSTSGGGGGSQASRSSSVCGQRRARTRSSAGASLGSVENSTKGQGNETKLSGEHRDTLDHQQSQGQDMVLEACASILSAKPDFLSRSLSSEAQTCLPAVEAERDNRKYARASFESNLKGSTVDGIVGVSRGFAGGTLVAPGTDNGHEYQLHQVTALNLVADTGFAKPNREVTGSSSIWMERAGNHFCEDSVAKVAAGSHAGSSIPPSLARLFLHPSPRLAPENDEAAPCGGRKTTVFDSIGPPPGLGAVSENQQFSPSSAPASSFLSRSGSYPCAIQSQEQDASGAIRPSQPLSIFPPRTDGSCRPRGDSVYSDFFSKGGGGDQSGDVSPSQEIRTEERPLFPLAAKIPMPSDAARVSSSFIPDDLKPAHELLAAALLQRPQNTADGGEQGWL